MTMKILIIGTNSSPKDEIAKALQTVNDDLQIAPRFTTSLSMKGKTGELDYYMSNEEAELSYKNDAFMWVRTTPECSCGVTKPDMYTYSLFVMSFADFNNMSNPVMNELDKDNDVILVVLDEKSKKDKEEVMEANNAFERIYEHHYMYFLDDSKDMIVDTILKYIIADASEREKIENSLNS